MHPLSGEENLQTGSTVGRHATNSVLMNIIDKSGQSFSSNKERIVIDIVNCQAGFFQLGKEITSIRKCFVVCFCFRELLIIFVRSLI